MQTTRGGGMGRKDHSNKTRDVLARLIRQDGRKHGVVLAITSSSSTHNALDASRSTWERAKSRPGRCGRSFGKPAGTGEGIETMNIVAMVHEERGAYGVSFPDFPGCTTVARDLDGVVAKAAAVLAFHAEGLAEDGALPTPRSMSELMRDPAFREDAEGALLVLVPYDPPTHAVRINITIEESLLARIDRAAEAAGETRSGYLAEAARLRMGEVLSQDAAAKYGAGFAERAADIPKDLGTLKRAGIGNRPRKGDERPPARKPRRRSPR
jgi:predicted RNase H-like HicB family nuclease